MRCYEHGGDIYRNAVRLDFSISTNPLGMPAPVRYALAACLDECSSYPDPRCERLCAEIARTEKLPESHILCGNGAADIIYRLVFSQKPKKALVCAPAFSEYERAVLLAGGGIKYHILSENEGFALTERILDDISLDIDMVFICNPNNPTGKLAAPELLAAIADKCAAQGALPVIDECFLPFTNGASLKTKTNAVILKAFTKLYSIPGLRLGYMLCADQEILDGAREHAQTWSVSAPAQAAGLAALGCEGWAERSAAYAAAERGYLTRGLRELGLDVLGSDANFILFKSARPLYPLLLPRGILVRDCGNFKGLDSHYTRIGVKTRGRNEEFLRAVGEVLNG